MSDKNRSYLGIDMGGTNIRFAIIDAHGRICSAESRQLSSNFDQRISAPVDIIREHKSKVAAVGLAIAGTLTGGVLDWSANLGLHHVDFGALLSEQTSKPVAILNDARAAGLAEALVGGGEGATNVLSVTVGTGIGGAFILDGRLFNGTGDAGEIGHMVVNPAGPACECGRAGCWERQVGGRALAEQARIIYPSSPSPIDELLRRAEHGDARALRVIDEAAWFFGTGIDNLCAVMAPDAIVLGGGIMARHGIVAQKYREAIKSTRWGKKTQIRSSQLGDSAGQIGAALAAAQISQNTDQ